MEDQEHVFMALHIKDRGAVGCAYYKDETLFCMDDIRTGGLDMLETLKLEILPTIVLVSPRIHQDDNRPGIVPARASSLVDDDGIAHLPYQVDIRPSQEFSYEAAKNKLISLEDLFPPNHHSVHFLIPGEPGMYNESNLADLGSTDRQGKLLRLSGLIDLDCRVSVGCLGAILACIQRRRAAEFLPDDQAAHMAYRVKAIEMFSLKGSMFINPDTLVALQIFQPESHPNAFNQGPGTSGAKESLSIYGLFQHLARTPQGKARLRQYFLRPCLDLTAIDNRHDFVGVLVRDVNSTVLQKMSKSMSKIKNIRIAMVHLRKGINGGNNKFGGFKSGVWATLLAFAYHTIDILDTLGEVVGDLPIRVHAVETMNRFELHAVGKMIHDTVDLDLSIDEHRTVVKHGINEELDNLKRVYDGMDDLLGKAAMAIVRTLPQHVDVNLNVIYFPQLGFYITVPIDRLTEQAVYDGGDEQWERMFSTQNSVYFKDWRMKEMDESLGDVLGAIYEKEIEIAYELAQRVLEYEEMLVAVSDLCGELDSLLALALGATNYKLVRPQMTDENVISIKGGRHVLQEMTVPSFVENDAHLVGGREDVNISMSTSNLRSSSTEPASEPNDGPSMLILTGPNYSGKSVYMKMVALIVYMAHIGSFVPAESARIGLTDKILTRITTRESVSKIQSAFMIDLQQIALALNLLTRRSLLIIDEFGKGTDASDGAGLLAGLIQHLLSLPPSSAPKTLLATHFHELFHPTPTTYLRPRSSAQLAFGHMAVHINQNQHPSSSSSTSRDNNSAITDQITHLYRLTPGLSTQSFGAVCAALNGVPSAVVKRAVQLGKGSKGGVENAVAMCTGLGPGEMEELEDAEAVARRLLRVDFEGKGQGEEATTGTGRRGVGVKAGGEGEREGDEVERERSIEAEAKAKVVDWTGVLDDILFTE